MADKNTRIITADTLARRKQEMVFQSDGSIVLNTKFDVEPVMLESEFERNHLWAGNFKGSPELRMLKGASIPMTLWLQLREKGILKDRNALRRWLADHPKFKTTDGNAI